METSPLSAHSVSLSAIDLTEPLEVSTLQAQRKICGWDFTTSAIEKWQALSAAGLKMLFWIHLPGSGPDAPVIKAGHISLASQASPPDRSLALPERSLLTISAFFILPAYRSRGIGRAVMDLMEDMARKEPACKAIALDTLSKDYYDQEHPLWPMLKAALEKQLSNQLWYERRGYVPFKVVPRYQEKGPAGEVMLDAVYLRKEL